MKLNTIQKRSVTKEQAIKTLRKNGIECDEKQTEEILDFLYFIAKLAVHQYFKEKKG